MDQTFLDFHDGHACLQTLGKLFFQGCQISFGSQCGYGNQASLLRTQRIGLWLALSNKASVHTKDADQ